MPLLGHPVKMQLPVLGQGVLPELLTEDRGSYEAEEAAQRQQNGTPLPKTKKEHKSPF